MARVRSWNPIAFVPAQVSIIISAVYIALFAVLLWVHHDVPGAPTSPTPQPGINLTQAWLDLDVISGGFHPLGSNRNDQVQTYLLQRIQQILDDNDADYKVVQDVKSLDLATAAAKSRDVTVFVDNVSNITFLDDWKKQSWSCYGESSNIIVYVRGTEDDMTDWWTTNKKYDGQSGVLVNAHYDSVASGYGATDDGVGVVTVLQLISYFSHSGHRPRRGLVALLNNGEENGLFGAHEYVRHPISQLPHIFLNLEGAGAGGRATLFRSTDAEVTRFYASSPRPFGTVISGDGFKRGLIRSGTDYSVFVEGMGMRGLDLAFYEPRQRYHTNEDDSRNTSPDSLWHMLSASLATVKGMTSHRDSEFEGSIERSGKLRLDHGDDGVWFDLLGRVFVVLRLRTLFALSVTLLVVGPILLIALQLIISRSGKWYPFARRQYIFSLDGEEAVALNGFRGFFRLPVAFVLAGAAVGSLAYLLTKINPYIVHSSEYAVWVMMTSIWLAVAWFVLAGADRIRPTALQRFHTLLWIYVLTWAMLVFATVGENNLQVASGYFIVIYNAAVGVALLISYMELLALPSKLSYAEKLTGVQAIDPRASYIRPSSQSSHSILEPSRDRGRSRRSVRADDDDITERTSLLRDSDTHSQRTLIRKGKQKRVDEATIDDSQDAQFDRAYSDEQPWSSSLPQWTWVLQFLILAPLNIVIVGQIALLATSAMNQTGTDGSDVLSLYLLIAFLTVLLLLPVTPFLHRLSYKLATVFLLIFAACLVYNLLAFPFSREARMKFYFIQKMDLDSGKNNVTLIGIDGHLETVVAELPSAFGKQLHCGQTSQVLRKGLQSCSWDGLLPSVVANNEDAALSERTYKNHTAPEESYKTWLEYNITSSGDTASIALQGRETKQCQIQFDNGVNFLHVEGGAEDTRFETVPETGSTQILLLSREWDKVFNVTVRWEGRKAQNQTGRVVCMWNDVNEQGHIPAWDEAVRFAPTWSTPTKGSDGLLEAYKSWRID